MHGANVQPDQIVMVSAELGQEELARAVAAAAYGRGAKFVDVIYFDPHLKRARVQNADPATLDYVPDWYGERLLTLADGHGARIALSGPIEPNLMDDLDKTLVGRDRLPWLKETSKVIADRSTNWTIVPCPNAKWAALVHPDLPADDARERLWREIEHVLRLDEPDRGAAWEERMAVLNTSAGDSPSGTSTRSSCAARARSCPSACSHAHLVGGRLLDGRRPAAFPEPADGRGLHDAGSRAHIGPRELDQAARAARRDDHPRPARDVRERRRGRRSTRTRTARRSSSQLTIDDGALKLGELALVDRQGRIGPLDTVFYDTLLDENAASHIALGSGFPFLVEGDDVAPRQLERHACRLHDRLAGGRRRRCDGRRRARPGAARRRLAGLTAR